MAKARKAKNWIQKAVPRTDKDRGTFRRKAKKAGMSTLKYAKGIINKYKGRGDLDKAQKKLLNQAVFARNTIKLSRK